MNVWQIGTKTSNHWQLKSSLKLCVDAIFLFLRFTSNLSTRSVVGLDAFQLRGTPPPEHAVAVRRTLTTVPTASTALRLAEAHVLLSENE